MKSDRRQVKHQAARLLPRIAVPMSLASLFWQPIEMALLTVATWTAICWLVAWGAENP